MLLLKALVHTYIYIYIYIYIYTLRQYICMCMDDTDIHILLQAQKSCYSPKVRTYTYIHKYIHILLQAQKGCVSTKVRTHTYIHKYIHTYIHKYIHTYIHYCRRKKAAIVQKYVENCLCLDKKKFDIRCDIFSCKQCVCACMCMTHIYVTKRSSVSGAIFFPVNNVCVCK